MANYTNNNNNSTSKMSNGVFASKTFFVKSFPDVPKIEVFTSQNFQRWQKRVSTLLDMYGVAFALTTSKLDSSMPVKQIDVWTYANKICCQTFLSVLSNDLLYVYCSYKEPRDTSYSQIYYRSRC